MMRYTLCFLLLCLFSCTSIPKEQVFEDFLVVRIDAGEDYEGLAARYLDDPEKAARIENFNAPGPLTPGRRVVIPLSADNPAGITAEGYQVVPVLSYQGFRGKNADGMKVSEAEFAAQMHFLKTRGYHVITLERFLDFLGFKHPVPAKSILITFDEAVPAVYDVAYPILRKYAFPAVVFVTTDRVGNKDALTWDQLKELSQNGFHIQSGTVMGRDLAGPLGGESFERYFRRIQTAISRSKSAIEQALHAPCRTLAYPSGKTDGLVMAVLQKEGYEAAFLDKGRGNPAFINSYAVHRTPIPGGYTVEQFEKALVSFRKAELK